MSDFEFQFEETGSPNKTNDSTSENPFVIKAVGYALLVGMAVIVVKALLAAMAGVINLIAKGVVTLSVGAAIVAAVASVVSIINEQFNKEQ